MRALSIALLFVAAGCRSADCKDGTLFLQLTFDSASAQADHLSVSVVVPGSVTQSGSSARGPSGSSGTLEIDFGGGYPAGKSVTVTVTAFSAGAIVGMGSSTLTLSGKCARVPLAVGASSPGGGDMATTASTDLAGTGPDFSTATVNDLASCVPSSASAPVFVDPATGVDDASHGAQPGNCAYKTITYALAHATGRINLNNTAVYQTAETFPLVLNGAQILDCDPGNTGTKARLVGNGDFTSAAGNVIITGTANQLLRCDISSPNGTSALANKACIHVLTSGPHFIDGCNLHTCFGTSVLGISGLVAGGANSSGTSVFNTTINNGISNCVNQIGMNWAIENMTCTAGNDGVNGCGTGLAGCGNTITAPGPHVNACSAPSGFETACAANTDMAH